MQELAFLTSPGSRGTQLAKAKHPSWLLGVPLPSALTPPLVPLISASKGSHQQTTRSKVRKKEAHLKLQLLSPCSHLLLAGCQPSCQLLLSTLQLFTDVWHGGDVWGRFGEWKCLRDISGIGSFTHSTSHLQIFRRFREYKNIKISEIRSKK